MACVTSSIRSHLIVSVIVTYMNCRSEITSTLTDIYFLSVIRSSQIFHSGRGGRICLSINFGWVLEACVTLESIRSHLIVSVIDTYINCRSEITSTLTDIYFLSVIRFANPSPPQPT